MVAVLLIVAAAVWAVFGREKPKAPGSAVQTETTGDAEAPRVSNPTTRAKAASPSPAPLATAASTPEGSSPSARFKEEAQDQKWASTQEEALAVRLKELDNPFIDSLGIECQSTCCKMSFSYEYLKDYGDEEGQKLAYNAVLGDLQSSVGFGSWASEMEMAGSDFYTCFDRSKVDDELRLEGTIRLEERKRLLAESMPELVECLPEGQQTAVLSVLAVFHKDGTVSVKHRERHSALQVCVGAIVRQWTTVKGGPDGFVSLPLILTSD